MDVHVDLGATAGLPLPAAVEAAAHGLRLRGSSISGCLERSHARWAGLRRCYRAPGQQLVHGAMDRPRDTADAIREATAQAAAALENFADALTDIRRRHLQLQNEVAELEVKYLAAKLLPNPAAALGGNTALWFLGRALQAAADRLAEDLRTAEDSCSSTLASLERSSTTAVPVYGGADRSFAVAGATRLFNRLANATSKNPAADFQLYLEALAGLSAQQMQVFLASNQRAPLTLPPPGTDPAAARRRWAAMGQSQRNLLTSSVPSLVGNLEGLPYKIRSTANNIALTKARRQQGLTQRQVDSYRGISRAAATVSTKCPARGLISFDPGNPPLAAVSIGDPDAADHVTWNIPGMGSSTGRMAEWTDATNAICEQQASAGSSGRHAAVAWIGYDSPADAAATERPNFEVLSMDKARTGGKALALALEGMNAARSGSAVFITVAAHSYGSTTAAEALSRTNFDVDAVVFYGSAGVDEDSAPTASVLRVKELDGATQVYATHATGDGVAKLGIIGSGLSEDPRLSPTSRDFGGLVFSSDGTDELLATTEHSARSTTEGGTGYLDRGTQSLTAIGMIAAGTGGGVDTFDEAPVDGLLRNLENPLHLGTVPLLPADFPLPAAGLPLRRAS